MNAFEEHGVLIISANKFDVDYAAKALKFHNALYGVLLELLLGVRSDETIREAKKLKAEIDVYLRREGVDDRVIDVGGLCQSKVDLAKSRTVLEGEERQAYIAEKAEKALSMLSCGWTAREAIAECCDGNAWWGEIAEEMGRQGFKEWRNILK